MNYRIIKNKLDLDTLKRTEIIDIILEIEKFIDESKLTNGIINIFSKHSTSRIIINENENGLLSDFENILNKIIPENNSYEHDIIDNNANSHIRSLFSELSEAVPFSNKKLAMGI